FLLEFATQLGIIVDAAVEGDAQAELGIDHRLAGFFSQVDDLQPAMGKGYVAMHHEAASVRSAWRQRLHHPGLGECRRLGTVEAYFSANSTHGFGKTSVSRFYTAASPGMPKSAPSVTRLLANVTSLIWFQENFERLREINAPRRKWSQRV